MRILRQFRQWFPRFPIVDRMIGVYGYHQEGTASLATPV